MHSEFRPSSTFNQPDVSALSGSDLAGSNLSAQFEMTGADISSAHQFFQPPNDLGAVSSFGAGPSLDAGTLSAPMITGAEVPALATPGLAPGADSVLAGVIAGANEPISPIIQIIMRLPGAMGLMSSFFEFLSNFFLNPMGIFDMLNPAFLGVQAAGAFSNITAHHVPLSFSLLPMNAQMLSNMGGFAGPMFSPDLLSAKLNISLGHSTSGLASPVGFQGGTLDASGGLDLGKPLYEGAPQGAMAGADPHGGILSGPAMTDLGGSGHVAGNSRLFSDQLAGGGGGGFNSMNLATKAPTNVPSINSTYSANSFGSSMGMTPQSLGSVGSPLGRVGSMPAIGQLNESVMPGTLNASNTLNSPLGSNLNADSLFAKPEMAQFDTSTFGQTGAGADLGGRQLLAMDNGVGVSDMGTKVAMDQPFRPTLGGHGQSLPDSAGRAMTAETQGLKATQLSLDSIKPSASDNYAAVTKPPATLPSNSTPTSIAPKTASSAGVQHGGNAHGSANSHAAHKPSDSLKHDSPARHSDSPRTHAVKHHAPSRNEHAVEVQPGEAPADEQVAQGTDATGGATEGATDAASEGTVSYTIQRGDCLWNIAKGHMGDGLKWQEIFEMNQNVLGSNPDLIYPGTTIQLPGGTEIANQAVGAEHYIVQPGDNLWNISRDHLGGGSNWGELYKMNQDVIGANPRLIHPGQELTLPGGPDPSANVAVDPSGAQADPTASAVEVDPSMDGSATTSGDTLSGEVPVKGMNEGTMENSISNYARQEPAGLPPTSALPQHTQPVQLGHSVPAPAAHATPVAHVNPAAHAAPQSLTHAAPAHVASSAAPVHAVPAAHHAAAAPHSVSAAPHSAPAHAPAAASLQQDPQNVFSPSISQATPSAPPNAIHGTSHAPSVSKGLPVIPANSQPVPGGPDAAQAATTHTNNAVVSSSLFADLQSLLKNRK